MGHLTEERKNKILRLGEIGEKIIRNMFSRQGLIVEDSLDVYDKTKDMVVYSKDYDEVSFTFIINKKTIEVKVCTPYVKKKAVTIRKKQLEKCQKVDDLYFVTIPHKIFKYEYSGWILKIDPKSFEYSEYPQPDKKEPSGVREMIAIEIEQPAVTLIRPLEHEELSEMTKYMVSGE
jgi:hypothetical protein